MKYNIDNLTLLQLVILVLASFRVIRFAVEDSLTEPLRQRIFKHSPHEGMHVSQPAPKKARWKTTPINAQPVRFVVTKGGFFGDLISCPWCAGFWVSLGWAVAWWFAPGMTLLLALPWALAGCSSFIAGKE